MNDTECENFRELLEKKLSKPCDMSPKQIAEIRRIWGDHIIGWDDEFTVEFEKTISEWIEIYDRWDKK